MPYQSCRLFLASFSDDLLEVADHGREWMWSGHRAKQIVRVLVAGDPIAQCLIDRVLKNAIAQSDFDHFGSKHPHAGHIQRLTTGIDLPHVDTAFQAEHGAYRGGCRAMLAGTGLGDDAGLAHALDQQRLTERIVVACAPVWLEFLALEEHSRRNAGLLLKQFGEARSLCQWAFPADVPAGFCNVMNSLWNSGSALASSYTRSSSSNAVISASGTYLPPN